MYSPKISEDLIPVLYVTAKTKKQPMTKLVDNIIRQYLTENSIHTSDIHSLTK